MTAALAGGETDLVILDVMLPGKSGLDLCREIRAKSDVPILMLTAMGEETDRIVGLEMGADDYLPKPFNSRELLARIRAILRRTEGAGKVATKAKALRFSGWVLDRARRRLTAPDGVAIDLTSGEYELLTVFAEHSQRVLNRDQLLDLARGREAMPFDRSIDVQVSRVRRKIETDPRSPKLIVTVRGDGYMFTPDVEAV
jgi:two-component system OmpR family response regulator